jgi:hypothetical protein
MGSVLFSEESPSIRLRDKELGQYKSLEVEIRRQILPRNATLIILLPDLKELIRLERVRPICTYRDETLTENQPRKQPDTSLLAFEYQFRDDLVRPTAFPKAKFQVTCFHQFGNHRSPSALDPLAGSLSQRRSARCKCVSPLRPDSWPFGHTHFGSECVETLSSLGFSPLDGIDRGRRSPKIVGQVNAVGHQTADFSEGTVGITTGRRWPAASDVISRR